MNDFYQKYYIYWKKSHKEKYLIEKLMWFAKKTTPIVPLQINGADVDIFYAVTFLGLKITESLDWHQNAHSKITKAQQHLYFLRKVDHLR